MTSQISFGNINERKRVCDEKTWRFSSVGRASALQAEGQRFEPVNLHHVDGEVAKWLNAADCNSVPFGSAVRICPSPPLESNTTCKSCVFFNLGLAIQSFFVKMVDGILCLTSFHFLIEGGV